MARRRRRTWYSEQGTEERPSATPGLVDLYRAGKFIYCLGARNAAAGLTSPRYPRRAGRDAARR